MAAVLLPYNISSTVYFFLIGSGTLAFSTAASGSLSGTNIYVSKDGGALATSTNTGTHIGSGLYSLVLTTSECSAKQVMVIIAKGTVGTVVEQNGVLIHTYGNASAMYPFDLGTALSAQTVGTVTTVTNVASANVVQVSGTAVTATGGRQEINVSHWLGTAAAGTTGKPNIGTADFLATGTVTQVTNAVTVTGTPGVNLVTILATAVNATAGTLTNIGTAGTALGTINADVKLLDGSATAAQALGRAAGAIVSGTATGTLNTTGFQTDFSEASNDHYKGRIVIFVAGTLKYQATDIISYTGSSVGTLSRIIVTTMTTAPAAGDRFVVV